MIEWILKLLKKTPDRVEQKPCKLRMGGCSTEAFQSAIMPRVREWSGKCFNEQMDGRGYKCPWRDPVTGEVVERRGATPDE